MSRYNTDGMFIIPFIEEWKGIEMTDIEEETINGIRQHWGSEIIFKEGDDTMISYNKANEESTTNYTAYRLGKKPASMAHSMPEISDVIFNPPATIIIWSDHTKTVVKCMENDKYDPEIGLSMAIAKKFFGNHSRIKKIVNENYKNTLKKTAEVSENFINNLKNLLYDGIFGGSNE